MRRFISIVAVWALLCFYSSFVDAAATCPPYSGPTAPTVSLQGLCRILVNQTFKSHVRTSGNVIRTTWTINLTNLNEESGYPYVALQASQDASAIITITGCSFDRNTLQIKPTPGISGIGASQHLECQYTIKGPIPIAILRVIEPTQCSGVVQPPTVFKPSTCSLVIDQQMTRSSMDITGRTTFESRVTFHNSDPQFKLYLVEFDLWTPGGSVVSIDGATLLQGDKHTLPANYSGIAPLQTYVFKYKSLRKMLSIAIVYPTECRGLSARKDH